jgi:hypothetical protein
MTRIENIDQLSQMWIEAVAIILPRIQQHYAGE